MLATGKGWVLPVLAMLAAKRRLRVAARGSGPGAKRRRPCPPLCAEAEWRCRDEGCPATPTLQERCRAGVEQRVLGGGVLAPLSSCPSSRSGAG